MITNMKLLIFVALFVIFGSALAQFPCSCDVYEPDNYVCGTNGQSFRTLCNMKCATRENPSIHLAHRGMCNNAFPAIQAPCRCTDRENFVCGTDGVSYTNLCNLMCAKRRNPNMRMAHRGHCLIG